MIFLKRGQSAVEFMIIVSGAFFFFIFIGYLFQLNIQEGMHEENSLLVKRTAYIIKEEIDLALNAHDGYFREFELSRRIGNQEYNVSIVEGVLIYIITHDKRHSISIPISDVNGDLVIGTNNISKRDGEVFLNV